MLSRMRSEDKVMMLGLWMDIRKPHGRVLDKPSAYGGIDICVHVADITTRIPIPNKV